MLVTDKQTKIKTNKQTIENMIPLSEIIRLSVNFIPLLCIEEEFTTQKYFVKSNTSGIAFLKHFSSVFKNFLFLLSAKVWDPGFYSIIY